MTRGLGIGLIVTLLSLYFAGLFGFCAPRSLRGRHAVTGGGFQHRKQVLTFCASLALLLNNTLRRMAKGILDDPGDGIKGHHHHYHRLSLHLLLILLALVLLVVNPPHPAYAEAPNPPSFVHVQHTDDPARLLLTLDPYVGDPNPSETFWFNVTLKRKISVPKWTLDPKTSNGGPSGPRDFSYDGTGALETHAVAFPHDEMMYTLNEPGFQVSVVAEARSTSIHAYGRI
jgi:hypothetical protein